MIDLERWKLEAEEPTIRGIIYTADDFDEHKRRILTLIELFKTQTECVNALDELAKRLESELAESIAYRDKE